MDDNPDDAVFSYDRVAYPTPVVPAQWPDQMAAAVLLHGVEPPDPETAAVLEIGCGTGLNLIGAAAAHPGARFVGFDLSGTVIAEGQRIAEAAGLGNVTLVKDDILTFARDGETFDYVTCHGVYTWVPIEVRDATMELIGRVLAPGGVAYVGYDCLPAAGSKAAINHFLREEVAGISGVSERIDAAMNLTVVLAGNQVQGSRLKPQLDWLVAEHPRLERGHFFHDWLAEFYNPVSVEDFAAAARANGLTYLGDSGLHDLFLDNLDEPGRALIESAGDDAARRSALLDLLHGAQMFRRSLLIKDGPILRRVDDPLARLRYSFEGDRTADAGGIRYSRSKQAVVAPKGSPEARLLDALIDAFPRELSLSEVVARSGLIDGSGFRTLLRRLVVTGLVGIHLTTPRFVTAPGERPHASRLARTMIERSDEAVTLREGKLVGEGEVSRLFLQLCDGTRSRAEIAAAMTARLGQEVPLAEVEKAISHFARRAVFEA